MTDRTTRAANPLRYAYEAIDAKGYAVPTIRRGIAGNWKKARRNSTDYFRMMRSVWYSPWFSDKNSTLENFNQGLKKLGRLAWMTVGAVPAAATFVIQSITKIPAVLGKKAFRRAGVLVNSKNPFKKILGGALYGIGAALKGIDYINRPFYGIMGLATKFIFANTSIPGIRLDRQYGIRSIEPVNTTQLQGAVQTLVKDTKKLDNLKKALLNPDFIQRTREVSGVMHGVGLASDVEEQAFTDETIGQFLALTKREIKQQERKMESEKKIGSSKPISRGSV